MELNRDNFEEETKKGLVVVDFWAAWCGPCMAFKPIFEKTGEEFKGKIKFTKVNVDENQELAQKYSVFSIPTMVILKDGQEIDRLVGALPENVFKSKLQNYLK